MTLGAQESKLGECGAQGEHGAEVLGLLRAENSPPTLVCVSEPKGDSPLNGSPSTSTCSSPELEKMQRRGSVLGHQTAFVGGLETSG